MMTTAIKGNLNKIHAASQKIASAVRKGNKVIFFGNGGSAAEAQHFAAEFINRMVMERRPLPAIALTTDSSVLTSIGNDRGFDRVFEMQLKALAKKEDIVFGISSSGNSPDVIKGMQVARKIGCFCIGLAGRPGRKISKVSDLCFEINSPSTPRIQESHLLIGHIICELVDLILFGDKR